MKKLFSIVVILVAVLVLSSAFNPYKRGLKPGNIAPDVELGDTALYENSAVNGRYTLLHFWASYDAPSRIANIRYNNMVEELSTTKLRYIAVSYERNIALFDEIVKRDGVNVDCQYYDTAGEGSSLYNHYRLSKGFTSYLIDADGTIVAKNPSLQLLTSVFGQ